MLPLGRLRLAATGSPPTPKTIARTLATASSTRRSEKVRVARARRVSCRSFIPSSAYRARRLNPSGNQLLEYLGSVREVHALGQMRTSEFEGNIAVGSELLLFAFDQRIGSVEHQA